MRSNDSYAPIGQIFDFVDPDEPVLRRVSLFQDLQVKVLVSDLC
jgi:hypothetical protein